MGQGSTRVAVLISNLLNFCLLKKKRRTENWNLEFDHLFPFLLLGMPFVKRSVLEGGDDGEGHPWKVVKDKGAAIFVMYGKGWHATFRLKKDVESLEPEVLGSGSASDSARERGGGRFFSFSEGQRFSFL